MTWVIDLDGVVWLADTPIAGSAEAIARLRRAGTRVVLVTNNSSLTIGQYLDKLDRCGIPATQADVITSAQVAAGLLEPAMTAFVCGGPGVSEALLARGVHVIDAHEHRIDDPEPQVDAVVVGWSRAFDFEALSVAASAVRAGARLIGTNDDATYPTPEGLLPGAGAILAAVSYAAGTRAEVAGKPHPATVAFIEEHVGAVEAVVGDRPATDGRLARGLGAAFALVLSGVTKRKDLPVDPEPWLVAADLASVVAAATPLARGER